MQYLLLLLWLQKSPYSWKRFQTVVVCEKSYFSISNLYIGFDFRLTGFYQIVVFFLLSVFDLTVFNLQHQTEAEA